MVVKIKGYEYEIGVDKAGVEVCTKMSWGFLAGLVVLYAGVLVVANNPKAARKVEEAVDRILAR